MDCDLIWMDDHARYQEIDDSRSKTGDGSWEMDYWRRMTMNLLSFHEDIDVILSCTILEIT